MKIIDYIPVGHKNAVTRKQLVILTGLSDRKIRNMIQEECNREHPILNIVDIGLRMLEPKELYGCQGFPDDYIIDHDYTGKAYPRTEQVRRCGNAVCPPIPAALVKANLPELCRCKRTGNIKIEAEQTGQLRFA